MAWKLYRVLIALIVVVFGISWIMLASSMGAPVFFILFGIAFVLVAAYILIKVIFLK